MLPFHFIDCFICHAGAFGFYVFPSVDLCFWCLGFLCHTQKIIANNNKLLSYIFLDLWYQFFHLWFISSYFLWVVWDRNPISLFCRCVSSFPCMISGRYFPHWLFLASCPIVDHVLWVLILGPVFCSIGQCYLFSVPVPSVFLLFWLLSVVWNLYVWYLSFAPFSQDCFGYSVDIFPFVSSLSFSKVL